MKRFIPILLALCLVTGAIAGTITSYPDNNTPSDLTIFAPVYDSTKPAGSKDGKVSITTLKTVFGANAAFVAYTSVDRAKQSDLTAHTGNTSNPHSVTAAQAGAPTLAAFTNYTSTDRVTDASIGDYSRTLKPADIITKGPWVDARAFATLAEADAYAVTTGIPLMICTKWDVPVAATINADSLVILKGGGFNGPGELNVNSADVRIGRYRVFFNDINVAFPNLDEVFVVWWGAKGDNATDCTSATRFAVAALNAGDVVFGVGFHVITDTITITKKYISIVGENSGGRGVSAIRFKPTSAKSCVVFDAVTAGYIYNNAVRNIEFTSERADGDFVKVAIECKDADHLTIEDVSIRYWYDSTGASEGIRLGGRQFIRCRNVTIYANKPLRISQNPYRAAVGNIDIDHSTFTNMFMVAGIPAAGEYPGEISGNVVTIDTGVTLTNVTFDGHQSWAGYNSHGLYWQDTTSTGASSGLNINNVRLEGDTPDSTGKHMFFISTNSGLQNLAFNNIYGGLKKKGMYLRNIQMAFIRSFNYVNNVNNEALNVDSTVRGLGWDAMFTQTGTTASIVGQDVIWAQQQETGALFRCARYASTSENTTQFISDKWLSGASVTVGNDSTLIIATNSFRGMIAIADSEGTSSIFSINGALNSTSEVSDPLGTYSVTKDQATTTNIYWDAGTSRYTLQNKRGGSRNYFITKLGG